MMRFFTILTFVIAAAPAVADEASALRAQLQTALDAQSVALKSKDFAKAGKLFDLMYDPSAKFYNDAQIQSYSEWKSNIERGLGPFKRIDSLRITASQPKITGSSAVVPMTLRLKAILANPNNPKQTVTVELEDHSHSTFQKRNGKWLCVKDVEDGQTTKVNGKVVSGGH